MADATATIIKVKTLVVDDEPDNVQFLQRTLRRRCKVITAHSGDEAIELLGQHKDIEAILTDQRMPGVTGVEVLEKACELAPHASRIIITGYTDFQDILKAINVGNVHHVLTKPIDPDAVLTVLERCLKQTMLQKERDHLLQALQLQNEMLDQKRETQSAEPTPNAETPETTDAVPTSDEAEGTGLRDNLTGLYSHSYFHERLYSEVARAIRHGRQLSLLLVDAKKLGEVNQTHGYRIGDRVLTAVAQSLAHPHLRYSDVAARYDGQRFAILLPETDKRGAVKVGVRLQSAIESAEVKTDDSNTLESVGVYLGVATLGDDGNDPFALVHAASAAVASAKKVS